MYKKILKFPVFFILIALGLLISPRQILAVCDIPHCPEGDTSQCAAQCQDCSWCQGFENITGKVRNPVLPIGLSTTPGTVFLQNLLQGGIRLFFVAGAIIFFFMLLIGGIKWISAGGDKARLESAQKQITHALVGLAILLSTFAIIKLVGYLFGIDLLKFTLPTL